MAVTFRAVIGEVNPIDFIAIEALRMFCPEAYDCVRNNRQMFSGHAPDDLRAPTSKDLAAFHEEWLAQLRQSRPLHVEAVKSMLTRLFPRLRSVWGNTHYGPEWEAQWRRSLRVCSETVFPVYFSLAVASGEISNTEMQAILAMSDNSRQFGDQI